MFLHLMEYERHIGFSIEDYLELNDSIVSAVKPLIRDTIQRKLLFLTVTFLSNF